MKDFLEKHYKKIIVWAFLLKLTLLPWTAHPFDFWAFVNQIQRAYLYDWNIFEFWNKWNFLLFIWYGLYHIYDIILFVFPYDFIKLPLLHFIFKLPSFFLDIISTFLIFNIFQKYFKDNQKAIYASLFWALNPIIFYVYGVHWHYELFTAFGILLIIYWLYFEKYFLLWAWLALSFSIKYFVIIFIPFFLLYLFINNKKWIIKFLSTFIVLVLLSFIQLIIYPEIFYQNIQSILFLSNINTPLWITEIKIPPINFFGSLWFIFSGWNIQTDLSNPLLYMLDIKGNYFSLIGLILVFTYRFFNVIKIHIYSINKVVADFFSSLLLFLIFLPNFQPHYIIWLIPFFTIFFFNKIYLKIFISIIILVGFIFSMRSEYGVWTFFMDIYWNSSISWLNNTGVVQYIEWSIIILNLVIILFLIFRPINIFKNYNFFYIWIIIFCWIYTLVVYTSILFRPIIYDKLWFARNNNYNEWVIYWQYDLKENAKDNYEISNNEKVWALIIETINQLDISKKNNFFIFLKDNNLTRVNLNWCNSDLKTKFLNQYTNKMEIWFKFPWSCLQTRNIINGFNTKNYWNSEKYIYITNNIK